MAALKEKAEKRFPGVQCQVEGHWYYFGTKVELDCPLKSNPDIGVQIRVRGTCERNGDNAKITGKIETVRFESWGAESPIELDGEPVNLDPPREERASFEVRFESTPRDPLATR